MKANHEGLNKEKESLRLQLNKGNEEVEKLKEELKIEENKAKSAETWQKNLKQAFKERDDALEELEKAKEEEKKLTKVLDGKGLEMNEAVKVAEGKVEASIAKMDKEVKEKEKELAQ